MGRLDNIDFTPTVHKNKGVTRYRVDIDNDYLKDLLISPRLRSTDSIISYYFCLHKWVYWTYGPATKLHRVCDKCCKKQKNRDILNHTNLWVKDNPKIPKTRADIREIKIESILNDKRRV